MAIWLRSLHQFPDEPGAQVGAASDVIEADEFGALLSIEQAYAQLEKDRQRTIEQARAEADGLIDAARESAQHILDDAKREYETAAQRGYREGEQRALSQWMERLAQFSNSERRMQVRMRERLAQIVTVGVERIVQVQHSNALFERALEVVDRIVEGAAYVRVLVAEADHDKACVAFERLAARWREMGRPFPLTVAADRKLPPGSCICESDFGSIDASLVTQLRAMRTAITRALKHSLNDMEHDDRQPDEATDDGTRLPGTPDVGMHDEGDLDAFDITGDEDTGEVREVYGMEADDDPAPVGEDDFPPVEDYVDDADGHYGGDSDGDDLQEDDVAPFGDGHDQPTDEEAERSP